MNSPGRRYPDNTPAAQMDAGGYALHTWAPWRYWEVKAPTGAVCSLDLNVHSIEEHEDGRITVSPSIQIEAGLQSFHGHLRRGFWVY